MLPKVLNYHKSTFLKLTFFLKLPQGSIYPQVYYLSELNPDILKEIHIAGRAQMLPKRNTAYPVGNCTSTCWFKSSYFTSNLNRDLNWLDLNQTHPGVINAFPSSQQAWFRPFIFHIILHLCTTLPQMPMWHQTLLKKISNYCTLMLVS